MKHTLRIQDKRFSGNNRPSRATQRGKGKKRKSRFSYKEGKDPELQK